MKFEPSLLRVAGPNQYAIVECDCSWDSLSGGRNMHTGKPNYAGGQLGGDWRVIRRVTVMMLAAALASLATAAAAGQPALAVALDQLKSEASPAGKAGSSLAKGAAPVRQNFARGNPLWSITLQSLSVTRERPVFSPSRRPPRPTMVPAPIKPPPPIKLKEPDHPLLSLVGTIVGDGARIGVFTDDTTKQIVRLRVSEGHDGWTLLSVQRREAIFKKDVLRSTLKFDSGPKQIGGRLATLAAPIQASLNGNSVAAAPNQPASSGGAMRSAALPADSLPTWLRSDTVSIAPPLTPTLLQGKSPTAAPLPNWLRNDGRAVPPPPIP